MAMIDSPLHVADRIELLAPTLLAEERSTADQVLVLSRSGRISLGWHYLLDVVWTNREIHPEPGDTVLDAGAGVGIMQWFLAERGVDVISVDRLDRSRLSLRYRARYEVRGHGPSDLAPLASSLLRDTRTGALLVDAWRDTLATIDRLRGSRRGLGRVTLLHSGLEDFRAIPDESVDNIVSISSLEHNDPAAIPGIVRELWRTLRPGGVLTATVGAAETDWYHEPSQGWCFSETTLRQLFDIAADAPSNYADYGAILEAFRANEELGLGLARSSFRIGRNGMPWGEWDPTYLSVGIRRQ
jgi:ubiquinone/menaquinone biosynthesis C-methylase UbiE